MKLDHLSDLTEGAWSRHVQTLRDRLDELLPGLALLERGFEVPGRGGQEVIAVAPSGRGVLVELAAERVAQLPGPLLERLAWFQENRPILPRLFPDRGLDPGRELAAVLLAPGFHDPLVKAVRRLPGHDLHLLRVRLLGSTAPLGFLVEDALRPDRVHPFAGGAGASSAPDRTPGRRGTARPMEPVTLLARAEDWLGKLSPDIAVEADGKARRFAFDGRTLAAMTPETDHLVIEVPGGGRLTARNAHELNDAMHGVIQHYFHLVGPGAPAGTTLRTAELLTPGELAEFWGHPPGRQA